MKAWLGGVAGLARSRVKDTAPCICRCAAQDVRSLDRAAPATPSVLRSSLTPRVYPRNPGPPGLLTVSPHPTLLGSPPSTPAPHLTDLHALGLPVSTTQATWFLSDWQVQEVLVPCPCADTSQGCPGPSGCPYILHQAGQDPTAPLRPRILQATPLAPLYPLARELPPQPLACKAPLSWGRWLPTELTQHLPEPQWGGVGRLGLGRLLYSALHCTTVPPQAGPRHLSGLGLQRMGKCEAENKTGLFPSSPSRSGPLGQEENSLISPFVYKLPKNRSRWGQGPAKEGQEEPPQPPDPCEGRFPRAGWQGCAPCLLGQRMSLCSPWRRDLTSRTQDRAGVELAELLIHIEFS